MDYFNDVLTTFLGLERGSLIAVYAGSKKLSDFIKKISVCYKIEGLMGLEQHEGE